MISIRGARQHNLRNLSLDIPSGKMTAFVGVSGSGKSSLAFDTLYAEGYRRYMDSLSIQARSFMEQMPRPDVDSIDGLSPSVAISQRITRPSPRATVASVTEISAYLRLLFAHAGDQFCPGCGRQIRSFSRSAIVDKVLSYPEKTRVILLAPLVRERVGSHDDTLRAYSREGFVRLRVNGVYCELSDMPALNPSKKHSIEGVIDRIVVRPGIRDRIAESIETALRLGSGILMLDVFDESGKSGQIEYLGLRASCAECMISLPEMRPSFFSQNSTNGMCTACDGLGITSSISTESLISHPEKSLLDGAIGALNGKDGRPLRRFLPVFRKFLKMTGISHNAPVSSYPAEAKEMLLFGLPPEGDVLSQFEGIVTFLRSFREKELTSDYATCTKCNGSGLRDESRFVRINGKDIASIYKLETRSAAEFFNSINAPNSATKPIVEEIRGRLAYMMDVGLGYLSLNRRADTLSGGELQRIRLATQIGSRLSGVIYVLDEPTIGLHPADTRNLIKALNSFLHRGNTVIVVEHNREVMAACDHIIELGPGAGSGGGSLTFQGEYSELIKADSLTGSFLSGKRAISSARNDLINSIRNIEIENASLHNLKGISVSFPVGSFTCVVGPSGAGKSTLAVDLLLPYVSNMLKPDNGLSYMGIGAAVLVDPQPLKRSGRSNITTYLGFAQHIRTLFSSVPEAKMRGYDASRFSSNAKTGRCESCGGTGSKRLEMVFMPDVFIPCEDCKGTGFNSEVLEIRFKGLNYAQIMDMEVAEAEKFFGNSIRIRKPLRLLKEIGLGYLKLGQSASTFSGGEAQRVKLAAGLVGSRHKHTLFVLDEPTIGLHFADIERLIVLIRKLVEFGHTVVAVEHDPEFIACADHLIELGPGGGEDGGKLIATGKPEEIVRMGTLTGREIAPYIG